MMVLNFLKIYICMRYEEIRSGGMKVFWNDKDERSAKLFVVYIRFH